MVVQNLITELHYYLKKLKESVEKYLKACLVFYDDPTERTHIITQLIDKCVENSNDFSIISDICMELDNYGLELRYPCYEGRAFVSDEEIETYLGTLNTVSEFAHNLLDEVIDKYNKKNKEINKKQFAEEEL